MKRTIKLALSASLLLGATSAMATNGDVMIGQGAKSRSMGGVGIAKSFGAESALANPAMINSVENMELTGALTMFTPSVAFGSNTAANATPVAKGGVYTGAKDVATIHTEDSDVGSSFIPEISFAHRLSDNFVYGVSVNGVAGMGTDYKDTAGTASDNGSFGMTTALSILKVSVPLAYTNSGFTIAVAPVFQYGTLEMNYMKSDSAGGQVRSTNPESSDTGFGFELGLAYDVAAVKGLTLAAVYKSKIEMEYADNIGAAMTDFGVQSVKSGDKLDQPAEVGFGVAYEISGNTIAFDYKNIQWSDAAGYGDFGWEDQSVFALGYEFATKSWAVRLGYNYGANPIAEQANAQGDATAYDAGAINFFNLSGFPGVVESHMTFGGGYSISDALSLDAAVVYAPEVTYSYSTSGMAAGMVYQGTVAAMGGNPQAPTPAQNAAAGGAAAATGASTADVTHSQMGITLAMTYKF